MARKSLDSFWRLILSFLSWLIGPGLVIPLVATGVGLVGGVFGGFSWIAVVLIVLFALAVGPGLLAGLLALWDRVRPLARVHLAEDEIGRIIDEGQSLKDHPIEGRKASFYECSNWWDSAATFIEAVFGKLERDRFMRRPEAGELSPLRNGYDDHIEARCDHLRNLADRLGGTPESISKIRVSRRKIVTLGKEQQAAAKSLLPETRELTIPVSEDASEAPPEEGEVEAEPELADPPDDEPDPSVKQEAEPASSRSRPKTARRAKLEELYIEGRKMQKAASRFAPAVGLYLYGPAPTDAAIDRWQGRVRAALPRDHRRRFKFAPLEARANEGWIPMPAGFALANLETEQAQRLRVSVGELKRIMDDLDEESHW